MATLRHVILLVEDDPNIARSVTQLLGVLGYDVVHVTSLEEGQAHVDRGEFCVLVTDLGILPQKESAKAEIELGYAMIEYARDRYPRRSESGTHLVPIIVLSAHDEHRFTREAFRRGIDDFLKKPLADNQVSLKDTIRECLRKCGRDDHATCAQISRAARSDARTIAPPPLATLASPTVSLSITGRTEGNRSEVAVGSARVMLANREFIALLALVDGRIHDVEWLEREAFGGDDAKGYKALSELEKAVRPYLPSGVRLTKNNRLGGYRLADEVMLETIAVSGLVEHADVRLRKLAAHLEKKGQRRTRSP